MSEQYGRQVSTLQRPTTIDQKAWETYWKEQGQLWRTEPEIDEERQNYLDERRMIKPEIEQGIYPFRGIKPQLTRADVEWLLATHENGRGPIDWKDESQRKRDGLDLRGADLCQIDLSNLPLARLSGGLNFEEWNDATEEQRKWSAVLMNEANLTEAHLEGANLREAQLKGADLGFAKLERAIFWTAQLKGADFFRAKLEGVDLRAVILSGKSHIGPQLADIQWGNTNLAVADWSQVKMLDDEYQARQKRYPNREVKLKAWKLIEYKRAVRANRQLTVVLRAQGLNEEADHFAYRAQRLQRVVSRKQRKYGRYLFSGFLDLLAGYGYRPLRSIFWYLVIIFGFALANYTFGHLSLWPPDAFIYSLTSFHGRGFFPGLEGKHSLHDPLIILAAFEAVMGLLIEISFIATFTQRFFGR